MNYVNGFVYGAGFTSGAFVVIILVHVLFHMNLCGG